MARKKHWEITHCDVSTRNGGLQVYGVNHFTGQRLAWAITRVTDPEYDFSGASFGPGAEERLRKLQG